MRKVRHAVFETNSSSSHSLTVTAGDLVKEPFSAQEARNGIVELGKGEFGWEWARLYRPKNKCQYLITQLIRDDIPSGPPSEVMRELCENDERVAMLFKVVKDHTGCELQVYGSSGYIDHDSEGVGLELFKSEETLRDFLFSESSYIETGNNNSSAPWEIETDRGPELSYEASLRDVPGDQVALNVKHYGATWEGVGFVTAKGAVLSEHLNAELFKQLCEQGTVLKSHWVCTNDYHYFKHDRDVRAVAAAQLLRDSDWGLKLARDFQASYEVKLSLAKTEKDSILHTFAVPQELASQLKALAKTAKVDQEIAKTMNAIGNLKDYIANHRGGKGDEGDQERLNKFEAELKRLKATKNRRKTKSEA